MTILENYLDTIQERQITTGVISTFKFGVEIYKITTKFNECKKICLKKKKLIIVNKEGHRIDECGKKCHIAYLKDKIVAYKILLRSSRTTSRSGDSIKKEIKQMEELIKRYEGQLKK